MANCLTIKNTAASVGDLIKVYYQFKEGEKLKEQAFEGILMAIRGIGNNKMITVRKMTKGGIGVERIFPVSSPFFRKITLVKKGRVRRAKIYFVRKFSEGEIRRRIFKNE